jgi:hypothetical protein
VEKAHHHAEEMPEPIAIDWPQYESLDKKYLVLGKKDIIIYLAHVLLLN